ncbi:hypothetical protein [Nocardia sp. NPDC052566]|uniref:hypothetical protein n=1 Tax=Nocardia sp. NPDC052566 TaxID=3364330 RepID=UPI0037C77E0C
MMFSIILMFQESQSAINWQIWIAPIRAVAVPAVRDITSAAGALGGRRPDYRKVIVV